MKSLGMMVAAWLIAGTGLPCFAEIGSYKLVSAKTNESERYVYDLSGKIDSRWRSPVHSDYKLVSMDSKYSQLLYDDDQAKPTSNQICTVAFTVLRDGQVSDLKLIHPSGDSALDNAALSVVRESAPYAVLPATLPRVDVEYSFEPAIGERALAHLLSK